MNYSREIARIILYLFLVLGLIYLLGYLLKNRLVGQKRGQYINILERNYLSSKTSIVLAEINNRVFLIGVTDNKLELLYEWEVADFDYLSSEKEKPFKDYIQSFMKKGSYGDMMNRRDNNEL